MLRFLFHTIAIFHYFYGLWYNITNVNLKKLEPTSDGSNKVLEDLKALSGRFAFLTIWNMLLQAAFFTICTLNDVIGSNDDFQKKKPLIRVLKDGLLTCLAFPLSMFVGITFWLLYAVDRELIFPKAIDEFFPTWLNHVMHTNIMIFVLIELVTSFRKYPSRKIGFSILMSFLIVYLIWIHIIHAYSGIWVYPVLEVLNLPLRIVFFLALLGFVLSLYILGEKLNNLIWMKRLKEVENRQKKVK